MLFGPHPCDDPNHGKTVGPVVMLVLASNNNNILLASKTLIQIHAHP
jgi:hypothetical protein